jgi:hypothetical protein
MAIGVGAHHRYRNFLIQCVCKVNGMKIHLLGTSQCPMKVRSYRSSRGLNGATSPLLGWQLSI